MVGRIVAIANVPSDLFGDEKFQANIKKSREKGAGGVINPGFDQVLAVTHNFGCQTGDVGSDVTEKRQIQALAIKHVL